MLRATVIEALSANLGIAELCATPGPGDAAWAGLLPAEQLHFTDQGSGDLGERLGRAAARALSSGEPVILIGADCPALRRGHLRAAAAAIEDHDAVILPAVDGGYVLLGLRRSHPSLFQDMPWSTSAVASETLDRIATLGWTVYVGETLQDIDRPEDLRHITAPAPDSIQMDRLLDSHAVLRTYERIAPFYDLIDLPFEIGRYRSIRPLLFVGLNGRILDAGVGTGRNIAFYPVGSEVFGVDLSPAMLRRAARRRAAPAVSVKLMKMNLAELDFPDGFFDAAVASFVFCAMPRQSRQSALRELRRVVKPGGRIRLLEYAPAKTAFRRALTRMWQPWVDWAFGAKLDQDIELELSEACLSVVDSRYVTPSIKLIEATRA